MPEVHGTEDRRGRGQILGSTVQTIRDLLSATLVDMAMTEHTINGTIAGILRETRRAWQVSNVVSSENTGMLRESARRPDILIIETNVSPVTIETEVVPAVTVESEAVSRL